MKTAYFFILIVFLLEGCFVDGFRSVRGQEEGLLPTPSESPSGTPEVPTPSESIFGPPEVSTTSVRTIPIPDGDDQDPRERLIPNGGKFCENYLIKKTSTKRLAGQAIRNLNQVAIDAKATKPPLNEWIPGVWDEQIRGYEIQSHGKILTLFRSLNRQAAGLAASFQDWYVEINGNALSFYSLSGNPSLVFWNQNGEINLFSVQFTQDFIIDKNWKNPRYDVFLYRWNDSGDYQLISQERNLVCK